MILTLNGKATLINRAEVLKWFGTEEEYLELHNQWVTDARAKWFTGDFD